VLTGSDFDLEVSELGVNFTGASRIATVVNHQLPGPVLRWREGDLVTVRVANRLSVPTSIHWHGVIVPADMDGVPGLSFEGIPAGGSFAYRFRVNQAGTYWYHSHSRFQEQTGLYGAIVIEPRNGERHRADRDYTVLLSDWTDLDPEHVYRVLKLKSDYFNFGQRTLGDFLKDARSQGLRRAVDDRLMWGKMRMNPTDLADVSVHAYTYLMNGVTPAGNWTASFRPGERVRLRFINGSSMSYFDVRIPGLPLEVIAADGQDVEPVTVDEFRIAAGEVFDVLVEPKEDRAYTVFAQSIDRTGYARGTLAPRPGMQAEVPPVDPRPLLTMTDMAMGHDMGSMEGMEGMEGMDHDMSGMEGMGHDMGDMPGHDMGNMPGMDHGDMKQAPAPVRHAPAEYGPTVDSLAQQPQSRLSDPGVGLRNNGRRVLTYADLHTLGGPIDHRPAGRDVELHLTGHMDRFIWSFSGQKFSEAEPLRFEYGERLRIVLVNDSMMNHPIHLHGMWGEVESEEGGFLVRKHTINVQPGQRLAYWVTADALGRWAYHCHMLYHMEAGMFREVVVERSSAQGERS
jgi:CopA family copper-resistance protein